MSTVESGNNVSFHYIGTLEDGSEFDNSYSRDTPMTSVVGEERLIPGFDSALLGMEVNEKKSIVIEAKDAYGEYREDILQYVPLTAFPDDFVAEVGRRVTGQDRNTGAQFSALILEATEENVKLDFNHPLAGKNLNFEIEVVSINDNQ